MFEDNPLEPSPFVFDGNDLSTFVDLDNFSNLNSSSSSTSRHLSPIIPSIADPQSDLNNLWFSFSNIHDDLSNPKPTIPDPVTGSPWDFLTFSNDSPDSGTTTSSGLSPQFAIDPQLMATPSTSKATSDFGDDDAMGEEHSREEEDDEDDEGPVTPPPVRPTNKGKDRKSGVHSGGIQKKVHISAVVKSDPFDNNSMDDWRPTPEEYQKLSSREKRQLRNKISARNFRNRRKGSISNSSWALFYQTLTCIYPNRIHQHP